ncbi:MAG: hypothetical protein JW944_07875 [Deltaproteobacteria bacterium]|nr:hypothetical protein [Deltaproteobacteria bacterium]
MIDTIMQVISDNRVWIMSLLIIIEVPVAFYIVSQLLSDGYKEFKDLKK